MPDQPVTLNWDLFHIVRENAPGSSSGQETAVVEPPQLIEKPRRTPAPGEPLAYCANCREWTPMRWRPKSERGKRAEQWFQCEYCGGRELTCGICHQGSKTRRTVMPQQREQSDSLWN